MLYRKINHSKHNNRRYDKNPLKKYGDVKKSDIIKSNSLHFIKIQKVENYNMLFPLLISLNKRLRNDRFTMIALLTYVIELTNYKSYSLPFVYIHGLFIDVKPKHNNLGCLYYIRDNIFSYIGDDLKKDPIFCIYALSYNDNYIKHMPNFKVPQYLEDFAIEKLSPNILFKIINQNSNNVLKILNNYNWYEVIHMIDKSVFNDEIVLKLIEFDIGNFYIINEFYEMSISILMKIFTWERFMKHKKDVNTIACVELEKSYPIVYTLINVRNLYEIKDYDESYKLYIDNYDAIHENISITNIKKIGDIYFRVGVSLCKCKNINFTFI